MPALHSTSPAPHAPHALHARRAPTLDRLALVIAVEAHGAAATLYLAGALDARAAHRAVLACDDIPRGVRTLRADLRNMHLVAAGALETFALMLAEWRTARGVHARLDPPPMPVFASAK